VVLGSVVVGSAVVVLGFVVLVFVGTVVVIVVLSMGSNEESVIKQNIAHIIPQ